MFSFLLLLLLLLRLLLQEMRAEAHKAMQNLLSRVLPGQFYALQLLPPLGGAADEIEAADQQTKRVPSATAAEAAATAAADAATGAAVQRI